MSTENSRYQLADRLVRNEVCYCVSGLISELIKRAFEPDSIMSEEDAFTLSARAPTADDYREALDCSDMRGRLTVSKGDGVFHYETKDEAGDEADCGQGYDETEAGAWRAGFDALGLDHPDGSEAFEHWLVSDWLARKLAEKGESVARDVAGLTVWARCTTGQAIALDSVIQDIATAAYGEA